MHPNYKDKKGRSRAILIGQRLYATSLQGPCVYSGWVMVKRIVANDKVLVDLIDCTTPACPGFDPRNTVIQNNYTHKLTKESTNE